MDSSTVSQASVLRFGVFELDCRAQELRKSGVLMRLPPQPFRILVLLASRPGQVVTREDIRQEIWGYETFVDFERGLNQCVSQIRTVLGDDAETPRYIETLPRRGYRFIYPVTAPSAAAGSTGASVPPGVVDSIAAASAHRREGGALPYKSVALAAAVVVLILAVAVGLNVAGLRNRLLGRMTRPPRIHSIAVLPLENLSGDPKQEYFAEGMTDELITDLSKISALRVIARTSTVAYRGSKKPLREIARELSVDAVVEGSVEEAEGRVRINVQLADASTQQNLWAASYQRDSKDVLSLQSDVAETIAEKIQGSITPQEKRRLEGGRTVNPAAHNAYLRGRYLFDQRTPSQGLLATQYFRTAIKLDPGYASAYAGLSTSLVSQSYLAVARAQDAMPEARAVAQHALQLDPDSGEAYTALGAVQFSYDWDWKAAEQNLRRGIELNPSDPLAETFYALYLGATGKRQQAVVYSQRAIKLDPVSFWANRQLAAMLYFDRQYNAALAQLERAEELQETEAVIDNWRSWIYDKKGMKDKSVQADLKYAAALGESAANLRSYRSAYARGGWRAYWQARVEHLLQQPEANDGPGMVAICYLHLGNSDQAIYWLNRAVDLHSIYAILLAVNPEMDPIRSDPRFQSILRRMNFPPAGNTTP